MGFDAIDVSVSSIPKIVLLFICRFRDRYQFLIVAYCGHCAQTLENEELRIEDNDANKKVQEDYLLYSNEFDPSDDIDAEIGVRACAACPCLLDFSA